MKKANYLIYAVVSIFLSGCGKDFDFSKKEETKSENIRALYQEDFKVEVISDPQPNVYTLMVAWPKDSGQVIIRQGGKRIFKSNTKQRSFERNYNGGERFALEIVQGENDEPVFSQEIVIPLDLEINNSFTLAKDFDFKGGRLFLQGVKIQTLGFNLNVEVDELFSDNGTIETYPQGLKAPFETNGRSAGSLRIRSKTSYGDLRVYLRGEDGGDGRSSACIRHFTILCNAASGGNGGSFGSFSYESINTTNFKLEVSREPSAGGIGGIACLYQDGTGTSGIPRHTFIGAENNCGGFGRGTSNGSNGKSGSGEVCLKLNGADKNVCE